MKEKLKNIPHRRWTELGICTVLALLLLVWALALELTEPDREATAAQKRQFAVARVLDVLEDNAETQDWTEGRRIGQQYLEIEILTGDWKGAVLETVNYLTIYTNVDAKVGTRIIVRLEADETGAPYILSVPNYNRTPVLLGLIAVFALLLVVIGRRKGLMALLGLAYTLASVWFILIPMLLRASDRGIRISGLFVSGILIASLGAVMDVAMSISSACWELREVDPALTRGALFRSGMNIGRDAMGTMANTLILAFAGSSLNVLILFQVYDYPMIQLFNADSIAVELIRGVGGSIGIILTVPLVAALSARIMGSSKKQPQKAKK